MVIVISFLQYLTNYFLAITNQIILIIVYIHFLAF